MFHVEKESLIKDVVLDKRNRNFCSMQSIPALISIQLPCSEPEIFVRVGSVQPIKF